MKKIISLSLALIMVLAMFASCGGVDPVDTTTPDDTTTATPDDTTTGNNDTPNPPVIEEIVIDLIVDKESDFKIVYPANANAAIVEAATNLREKILLKTGVAIAVTDDTLPNGQTEPEAGLKEILIGKTNRAESQEAFEAIAGYSDYSITVVDSKLVLIGGGEAATAKAVSTFVLDFVNELDDEVVNFSVSNNDNYKYKGHYPMATTSLLGTPIGEFRIVLSANYTFSDYLLASKLASYYARMSGKVLEIAVDSSAATDHEIRIGATNRTTVTAGDFEYVIAANSGSLEVACDSMFAYDSVYNYFTNKLRQVATEGASGELVRAEADFANGTENAKGVDGDIRLMVHNTWGWDNSADGPRMPATANALLHEIYSNYMPDILALQEYTDLMREANSVIESLAAFGYAELDVAVEGEAGVKTATPLIYRADKLDVVLKGCERIDTTSDDKFATWAIFQLKNTNKKIGVMSVHYAYQEDADARRAEQADLTSKKAAALAEANNCPFIICGDMNMTITAEAFGTFADNGFADIQTLVPDAETSGTLYGGYPVYDAEWGFFDRDKVKLGGYSDNAIDHAVYAGTGVTFNTFDIVSDSYSAVSSDHAPILIDMTIADNAGFGGMWEEIEDWTWDY